MKKYFQIYIAINVIMILCITFIKWEFPDLRIWTWNATERAVFLLVEFICIPVVAAFTYETIVRK